MPFSLDFEGPATGTTLRRIFSSQPPSTVDVVFTPANSTESLVGAPARNFVNANPGPGERLTARLETPNSPGKTNSFTVTVTPSNGGNQGPSSDVGVELDWN